MDAIRKILENSSTIPMVAAPIVNILRNICLDARHQLQLHAENWFQLTLECSIRYGETSPQVVVVCAACSRILASGGRESLVPLPNVRNETFRSIASMDWKIVHPIARVELARCFYQSLAWQSKEILESTATAQTQSLTRNAAVSWEALREHSSVSLVCFLFGAPEDSIKLEALEYLALLKGLSIILTEPDPMTKFGETIRVDREHSEPETLSRVVLDFVNHNDARLSSLAHTLLST
eukprot:c5661_g1_i2.p1 GENE.c5661_g1_i2~~c5661_g1_i2.p1  ORF type:complete len:237 (+),score=59.64 c5661_g1_i2:238-948(+)